jgi:hypothetical protein
VREQRQQETSYIRARRFEGNISKYKKKWQAGELTKLN